ncbi:PdxA family dehydrogenase [Aerosticca soli]|uniref:4-hydroxythreonine-4-phosphate dehydrogenase n=1 Tax=Aerosticca soli TaxID=2010829 RepID=A0A2Z6E3V0_9GAMM|nr:4-hydroxythreonine-4-phosphate dehydrogenase PdxA [Aerosticca soli]BBD79755.1 4-hydroxythreonine-4-phosphate dehydrogenase [Aerosticca soli]
MNALIIEKLRIDPARRARVGIVIGDVNGIGPEVVAKSWQSGLLHEACLPVLIGSAAAMERAVAALGMDVGVRAIAGPDEARFDPKVMDVIDSGALDPAAITPGRDTAASGRAVGIWLGEADRLARAGALGATVMAPVSAVALEMAGMLDRIVSVKPGETYLVLFSGALRITHLTDHVPLREVSGMIHKDLIALTLHKMDAALRQWGIAAPRIAVAGFNPHAKGTEDSQEIAPGVAAAKREGIDVTGPVSPDSVFRHCLEGRYDMVLAMYHDQGHIAIKTAGFSGNVAVFLGPPYPQVTVAHGTAYDIVGRGIADHSMVLNAILTAGSLAAGNAFPDLH